MKIYPDCYNKNSVKGFHIILHVTKIDSTPMHVYKIIRLNRITLLVLRDVCYISHNIVIHGPLYLLTVNPMFDVIRYLMNQGTVP